MAFLASLASQLDAAETLVQAIRQANTARHVLELCRDAGLVGITSLICQRVAEHCARHAGGELAVKVLLVDFGGALLGGYPEPAP
jgi:cobalt-precorrin-5B (C1)-methyltransferase